MIQAENNIGLAFASALVTFFFIQPLTPDGMVQEDRDVSDETLEHLQLSDNLVCG